MTINDQELSKYLRQFKNSVSGHKDSEGEERDNMSELLGKGNYRELQRRFKALEIAAQLAQQRLGKIT